jgi:hypothetical protein
MITNASSLPLTSASNLPNVQGALDNWLVKMLIGTIVKSTIDFQLSETVSWVEYQVVLQPFTTKKLQVKPEGQRAWAWWELHIKGTDQEFCLDDQIFIKDKKCRIMQKFEWASYGYTEYQVVEDFGQLGSKSIAETSSILEGEVNAP